MCLVTFVKQGISLHKAISSGYFHATQQNKKEIEVPYDNGKIKHSILRIFS